MKETCKKKEDMKPRKTGITLERDEGNSQEDSKRKSRMTADSRSRGDWYGLEQEDVRSRKGASKKQVEWRHDVFDHSERVS